MTKKVLIIEELSAHRRLLRGFLEPLGFSVDEVNDAEEGYTYCMKRIPDLIFLDWDMNTLSGVGFLHLYKDTLGQTKKLPPIVFCIKEDLAQSQQEEFCLDVVAYLMKPFEENCVQEKLKSIGF